MMMRKSAASYTASPPSLEESFNSSFSSFSSVEDCYQPANGPMLEYELEYEFEDERDHEKEQEERASRIWKYAVLCFMLPLSLLFVHSLASSFDSEEEQYMDKAGILKKLSKRTPLSLPLQPPYQIFQVGHLRSGSAFQFHLLDAISQIKTQGQFDVSHGFGHTIEKHRKMGESYIFKTHALKDEIKELQKEGDIVLFSSGLTEEDGDWLDYTLYNQELDDLYDCDTCEVDKYKHIFGLTDNEIRILKEYMELYSTIRQCCGLQMSQYEVARLNGCDMSKYMDRPEYPHCEQVDKHLVELDFVNQPITPRTFNSQYNWARPGDCARFDEGIKAGFGLNGRPFDVQTDCPL